MVFLFYFSSFCLPRVTSFSENDPFVIDPAVFSNVYLLRICQGEVSTFNIAYSALTTLTYSYQASRLIIDLHRLWINNVLHMTRFWNSLHEVRSNVKE